jgi:hypothetical protein
MHMHMHMHMHMRVHMHMQACTTGSASQGLEACVGWPAWDLLYKGFRDEELR